MLEDEENGALLSAGAEGHSGREWNWLRQETNVQYNSTVQPYGSGYAFRCVSGKV